MNILRSLFHQTPKTQASTEATPLQSPATPEAKKSFFGHFVSWFQNLKSPFKDSSSAKLFGSTQTGFENTLLKEPPELTTDAGPSKEALKKFTKAAEELHAGPRAQLLELRGNERTWLRNAVMNNEQKFDPLLESHSYEDAVEKHTDSILNQIAKKEGKTSDDIKPKYSAAANELIKQLHPQNSAEVLTAAEFTQPGSPRSFDNALETCLKTSDFSAKFNNLEPDDQKKLKDQIVSNHLQLKYVCQSSTERKEYILKCLTMEVQEYRNTPPSELKNLAIPQVINDKYGLLVNALIDKLYPSTNE